MNETVVFQFSTTRKVDGGAGLLAFLNTCKLVWQNRYSWAIRLMCHSPFSHVDFVLPLQDGPKLIDGSLMPQSWRGMLLGASSMGDNSPFIAGNPNGVAVRPHDYQEFGYRRQLIIKTPLADTIFTMALQELGKPFDNGALKQFLSPDFPGVRDWRDNGSWFCAEYGARKFEQAGYYGKGGLFWPKNRVSPTDLLILHLQDDNCINRETFWDPIPGRALARWET